RDGHVTGVQTCALPIWTAQAAGGEAWADVSGYPFAFGRARGRMRATRGTGRATREGVARTEFASLLQHGPVRSQPRRAAPAHRQIGRASCRERVAIGGV